MKQVKKIGAFNAIWLITLLPVVLAWAMAHSIISMPESTRNNGELVAAGIHVPMTLTQLQQGKWGLVVVSANCDITCQQQVYRLQQLHKSMGKFYGRIQPIWLLSQPVPNTKNMAVDLDLKQVLMVENNTLITWFNNHKLEWQDQSIWLIDPAGNLVMRFQPELSARQVMSDLQWLLKVSRLG